MPSDARFRRSACKEITALLVIDPYNEFIFRGSAVHRQPDHPDRDRGGSLSSLDSRIVGKPEAIQKRFLGGGKKRLCSVCRPTGNYPKTGFEEIPALTMLNSIMLPRSRLLVAYLDRDMEFVWTPMHLDKMSWHRSSSVQIKPLQPTNSFFSANPATIRIDSLDFHSGRRSKREIVSESPSSERRLLWATS